MILHNTTFVLEERDTAAFLSFIQQTYIPALARCPEVQDLRLHRIHTEDIETAEVVRFALHFYVPNVEHLETNCAHTQAHLHGELSARFGQRVLSFATTMEEIGND